MTTFCDSRPLHSHLGAWIIVTSRPGPFTVAAIGENGTTLAESPFTRPEHPDAVGRIPPAAGQGEDCAGGILLLPPRPARLRDAARGTGRAALVLHGPVRGADDRSRPHHDRRHADRQRAYPRPARPAAARAFAFNEPNYQASVYRDVLLRRWRNLLGRIMWDYPGGRDGSRYLVLGLGAGPAADLPVSADPAELIAFGPLLSDDGSAWLGTVALVRAPDPDTAGAILTAGRYASIEVHSWQFGGRPS